MIKPKPQSEQIPSESEMNPQPEVIKSEYQGSNKLSGKVALISGGDSGIGRSVAVLYAREGADIAILYHSDDEDAKNTQKMVESENRKCIAIAGDIGDESFCKLAVKKTIDTFGKLNILVNNAAEQHPQKSLEDISAEQLERTFRTNIFGMFYLTKAALNHLEQGDSIINTTSITAYRGSSELLDYSATKGAIVSFTRSLSQSLLERQIRVNGVAPGPIWTPLIPATFPDEKVETFGQQVPMQRAGQPSEVAPSYLFLASNDSTYFTGQILHPNGGAVING